MYATPKPKLVASPKPALAESVSANALLDDVLNDKSLSADAQTCKQTLNGGSKSFHAASLLLPKSFAHDATALYAFCRLSDDLIDDAVELANEKYRSGGVSKPANLSEQINDRDAAKVVQPVLQSLFDRLDQLYRGQPYPHPADRALMDVINRHRLPKSLLLSLFEGFEWDASGREYETLEDVQDYGARVAGTVGVMMSVLMGQKDPDMTARAADLGIAMQLTNIARDVGEDARAGRLYLPRQWMREAGIDPEHFLAEPIFSVELKQVISRLLNCADELYAKADSGIALLPLGVRAGMYAARLLYSEIGNEIRRLNYNSIDQRAVVSSFSKARVLMQLTKLSFLRAQQLRMPALQATQYLVDIIANQPDHDLTMTASVTRSLNPFNGVSEKAIWVLDLFDELDKRDARLETVRAKAARKKVRVPAI